MKTLICHLGLGDTIILAGAAVILSERHGGLRFPCWEHNLQSVESFFVNHPKIIVEPIKTEHELFRARDTGTEKDFIMSGYYAPDRPKEGESFDQWFYRQLEVPFEESWNSCPIEKACPKEPNLSGIPAALCAFVHQDIERGFIINKDRIPRYWASAPNIPGQSILRFAGPLKRAQEIHVIESSFQHLIERIPTTGTLYAHRYARSQTTLTLPVLKKNWTILI